MDLEKIKIGTKVSYDLFKNMTFEGTNETHVILKTSSGQEKKVLKTMFLKHGRVIG